MDLPEPPQPEQLAAELAGMLRGGITTGALASCPYTLGLPVVAARSVTDAETDRAVAAHGLLRQLAGVLDGDPGGPVATLLGLAAGTRGTLLKDRRRLTAELLHISPAHLRTSEREEQLIEALADELYAADSAYRLRHKHRTQREREPTDSGLHLDWYDLHQTYRRIWTPISALRDDLWVLLKFLRDDADWPDIADRVMNLCWRLAQYSRELDRFIDERGGLWLLADIDSEVAAAEAIRRIGIYLPFGEADVSWLRLVLDDSPGRELDGFSDRLYPTERGKEFVATWLDWARGCDCRLDEPDPATCPVHRWMAVADEFIRLIDKDWYRVADFYRANAEDVHGAKIQEVWDNRR